MTADDPSRPRRHRDVASCVEQILRLVGPRVVLGIPLGIGKPNHIVNELYRRVEADPSLELEIQTALTLRRRTWGSELARRLIEPINERLFGDYPELAYAEPFARGTLPANIEVVEFYLAPGQLVDSPSAQQHHASLNYTFVLDRALRTGINVFAQLVSPGDGAVSLSCNADIGAELIPALRDQARRGARVAVCAQVNDRLPYMPGRAEIAESAFDVILDAPEYAFELPIVPRAAIDTAEHWIGLHAAALIRDGGTIQLGIGALADAVTHALLVRHRDPARFRALLDATPCAGTVHAAAPIGGTGRFERGLYAATEMLVDGVLELYRAGILRRRVFDCAPLQRLLDEGALSERVDRRMLDALREAGVDLASLRRLGVIRAGVPDLPDVDALPTLDALDRVTDDDLGDELRGGAVAHAGFFAGSRELYQTLRAMPPDERARFAMAPISFVNQVFDDGELKRAQRRHARFINTGLIATVTGAVASDGLEDGRVVSGVGGQYNFVAMAHALPEGRSILLVRATRDGDGEVDSNIRYSYGHTTIPRHLRDILVTEYGVADLRDCTDGEVIARVIEIADSRFQDELVRAAVKHGKLSADYRVPDRFRRNLPERLEHDLAPHRGDGRFAALPFGGEVTAEERVLGRALRRLKEKPLPRFETIAKTLSAPAAARPYLARMQLDAPSGLDQRAMRAAVLYALSSIGAI